MCNIWLGDRFSTLKQCLISSPLYAGVLQQSKTKRGKTLKDIVGILQKQRGHPRLFDHGSRHQGPPAPEKLHTQNKLWAQQRERDDEYPSGEKAWSTMKAVTLKVYTSHWNVFEPYMVSSPSQVDTYWSILLPPFGNYKLEPEIQQNSHYVCSGATSDISSYFCTNTKSNNR